MAKPVLYKISPFDASSEKTISFTYSGDQPYKNKLTIYDATTLSVEFTATTETMKLENTIPAGTLTNGTRYAAEVVCYDGDDVASTPSDKAYFWVLSTPTFEFDSITEGTTIKTASALVTINYDQAQYDILSQLQFFIYDSTKNLLESSSIIYNSESFSYTYKGLDNVTTYYIQATGLTEKGIVCDTGLIEIFVKYTNPKLYSTIYAESDDCGIVNGFTNFTVIAPERENYTYKDGFIQLQDDVIIYSSSFEIDGDFTFAIRFRNASDGTLCTLSNSEYTIVIAQFTDDSGVVRYSVRVKNAIGNALYYSDSFTITSTDVMTLWLRRISGMYELKVINGGAAE